MGILNTTQDFLNDVLAIGWSDLLASPISVGLGPPVLFSAGILLIYLTLRAIGFSPNAARDITARHFLPWAMKAHDHERRKRRLEKRKKKNRRPLSAVPDDEVS
jgi:hypothetical protein